MRSKFWCSKPNMCRISYSYLIQNWSHSLHKQPCWKGQWKKVKHFSAILSNTEHFWPATMWLMYLMITAQLSNIKGFPLIPGEAAADQDLFYKFRENTFENRWSFSAKLLRELSERRRPILWGLQPGLYGARSRSKPVTPTGLWEEMVTVVRGWATHGSTFKDQAGKTQERNGNKLLQPSPAQVFQPGFLSTYPFPPSLAV